jgi:hypothetical protein
LKMLASKAPRHFDKGAKDQKLQLNRIASNDLGFLVVFISWSSGMHSRLGRYPYKLYQRETK